MYGMRTISTFVPERRSDHNPVTEADVEALTAIVGDVGIITEKDEVAVYNADWQNKYFGHGTVVLRPGSTGTGDDHSFLI